MRCAPATCGPGSWSTTATRAPSTPRCGSPSASSTPGSPRPPAAPATATTTPWPRTSGRHSRSSSCTGPAPRSTPGPRPSTPWSATSTAGTTHAASKPASEGCLPTSTKTSTTAPNGTTITDNEDSGQPGEPHGISRQCLWKWHRRWLAEGEAGLADRSSRPSRSPRRLSATVEKRIERLRRDRNLGPDRIAYELRREGIQVSASGVHRVLVRLGINRLRDLDPPTGEQLRQPQRQPQHPTRCAADSATSAPGPNRWRRYERERPGELIHIDVKKLGHIRPGGGWWAHGRDSAQARASRSGPRVGYDYVHVAVDDHSRLAYVEVITSDQGGENAAACAGFLRRAAAFYAGDGIHIEQ